MKMTLENRAALDFVVTLRRRWADTLYPHLRAQYDEKTSGVGQRDAEIIAAQVHALPSYGGFAWLERGAQKMLWRAAIDSVSTQTGGREDRRAAQESGPSTLELEPDLVLPKWYTEWDIHIQPGGLWSSVSAGKVYELGARLVMLGENDDYKFHRLFTETAIPRRDYRCIVDLGCGFGKSTWPLKRAYPQAGVIGIDLSAPCLSLGARRADEQGLAIRFRQADVVRTGLESSQADLVTATMLIHELPLEVLAETFREAARLLAPGGLLRILDFQFTGDAVRDLAMREHGARNNEPFMPPMMAADTAGMAEAAGLGEVRWTAFDEREIGRLPTLAWPKRSEWHFPWAVLEAQKAA